MHNGDHFNARCSAAGTRLHVKNPCFPFPTQVHARRLAYLVEVLDRVGVGEVFDEVDCGCYNVHVAVLQQLEQQRRAALSDELPVELGLARERDELAQHLVELHFGLEEALGLVRVLHAQLLVAADAALEARDDALDAALVDVLEVREVAGERLCFLCGVGARWGACGWVFWACNEPAALQNYSMDAGHAHLEHLVGISLRGWCCSCS